MVTSDSEHAYVLNCYINEDAKHDKSSGIAGAGYDVVYLTEMGKLFDNCHHMFTEIYLQPMQQQTICWNKTLL